VLILVLLASKRGSCKVDVGELDRLGLLVDGLFVEDLRSACLSDDLMLQIDVISHGVGVLKEALDNVGPSCSSWSGDHSSHAF